VNGKLTNILAGWQHQRGSRGKLGTDRTEQIGRLGALIVNGARARTLSGPAIGQLVLLADPHSARTAIAVPMANDPPFALAVFGAPVAFEDAPLRACRAALAIQQQLVTAGPDLEAEQRVRPRLRIGL
jgi:hypothetical protein